MIILVYIVMLLCVLAVSAKLSLMPLLKGGVYGLLFLVFSWLVMPYAIDSSRNEIQSYLSSYEARQYVAILVTIECAIALAFAFRQWQVVTDMSRATRWQQWKSRLSPIFWWVQKYYVSLLVLPTLFFVQTQVIYALPGVDFRLSALIVGVGSLILFPMLGVLFRWVLPLRSMREELSLALSVLLCLSALFSTMTEEMLFAPTKTITTPLSQYILALGVGVLLFAGGWIVELRKRYKLNKANR